MSTLTDIADSVKEGAQSLKEKAHWEEIQETVQDTTKTVVNATARFIRENPWKAAGLAAITGLTVAILIKNCLQGSDEAEE